jgi:hypothetical protein
MTQKPRFSIEKGLFFSLKVFSSYYPHFGKVKNKKKTLSKKVVGSPGLTLLSFERPPVPLYSIFHELLFGIKFIRLTI